ncbi:MAG: DEAD/DEAH box helicase [Succinivibrio sp.]
MLQEVKDLQNQAIADLVECVAKKDTLTFKAPTGSGKTFIMARFMDEILKKDSDVIFLVSSLSKAKLAQQNYNKFQDYVSHGYIKNVRPYLISSEDSGENALFIPSTENIYVLPRDLYKDKSKLKGQQALLKFIQEITLIEHKRIFVIKDESHIKTNNLDELKDHFSKVINISATPKGKPDVELKEIDAINCHLIKSVEYKSSKDYGDDFSVNSIQYKELIDALRLFNKLKYSYLKFNIKPCLIIQISNKELGLKQLELVKQLLSTNEEFKDLKWISVADDPKACDTNDQLIKSSPLKWEEYAVKQDSLIDIIIFKMKITEGWDIPRANMLFQIRDSQSKQLDEQIIGRVRRNPMLLNFDKVTDLKDQKMLTTAYVWGVKEKSKESSSVEVILKGNAPDDIRNISNEIQKEIKVNVTKLLDKISTVKNSFSIADYLSKQPASIANKSIFELYESFNNASNKIQAECLNYVSDNGNSPYSAYFAFVNNINSIKAKLSDVLQDYSNSIEIVKNSLGKNLDVTLPFNSMYIKDSRYSLTVHNSVWNNGDKIGNFTFDSMAEVEWLNLLLTDGFIIKKIPLSDDKEVALVGKNYLPNSDIKYEYYNNDGRHFSYPDFILKNTNEEYFLFEVKSLNESSSQNISLEEYKQKITVLLDFYRAVSEKVSHYFCFPIKNGETWTVHCCFKGQKYRLDYSQLKAVVNGGDIETIKFTSE